MSRYAPLLFLFVSLLLTDSAKALPPAAELPPGYVVAARYVLTPSRHGFDGAVELLQDGRLTPARIEQLKQYYWFGGELTDDTALKLMELGPLAPALLRLLDARGRTAETRTLDSPFGALGPFDVLGLPPGAFWLMVWRGGFGAILAEVTLPFRLDGGALRPLVSVDAQSGETEPLELMRGVKTDWRTAKAQSGEDLLQVFCRPGDSNDVGFGEVLIRYRLDKGRWSRRMKQIQGYCDWPGGFPDPSLFP
jgi:hypothetical protein